MPIIKLYRNGSTAGNPPTVNNHKRAKRSKVIGWSKKSARSQRQWFYSQNLQGLSGHGYAFTNTVRSCPDSSAEFHSMRDSFIKRLVRMGAIRTHWLVEWQARGVPHLHGCAYFENEILPFAISEHWLDVSMEHGSSYKGQNCKPIHDAIGWLEYLAKHGARGVYHYQRSNLNIPESWKTTGRMWGYTGSWPIEEPMRFELNTKGFHAFRRIARYYEISRARSSEADPSRRISYARRMLKCADRNLSSVRGISEWFPVDLSAQIVVWLGSSGYEVKQVFQ